VSRRSSQDAVPLGPCREAKARMNMFRGLFFWALLRRARREVIMRMVETQSCQHFRPVSETLVVDSEGRASRRRRLRNSSYWHPPPPLHAAATAATAATAAAAAAAVAAGASSSRRRWQGRVSSSPFGCSLRFALPLFRRLGAIPCHDGSPRLLCFSLPLSGLEFPLTLFFLCLCRHNIMLCT
jgi:hypothetical protein